MLVDEFLQVEVVDRDRERPTCGFSYVLTHMQLSCQAYHRHSYVGILYFLGKGRDIWYRGKLCVMGLKQIEKTGDKSVAITESPLKGESKAKSKSKK